MLKSQKPTKTFKENLKYKNVHDEWDWKCLIGLVVNFKKYKLWKNSYEKRWKIVLVWIWIYTLKIWI